MIESLKEIFDLSLFGGKAPKMTEQEKQWQEVGQAIISKNWVKLNQIAHRDNLTGAEYLDRVAMAACHVYAAGREPTRCKEWTAIETLLETIHFPEWSQAVDARHKLDT